MYYLVHCDTHECLDFQAIIGIADSKRGLMELLFNYHKYHFVLLPNITFETSHFDIQILKITEENYNFLLNEINDKLDKITENHEKQNFKPECSNSEFLFVILNNDEPQYDIFEKDFHKKYKDIVKESKQLII
jgi:hypothetical protein